MAYCEQCGAYIPDGQEKCLACGYDPAQAARAYQTQARAEEKRRERERQERERQEERRHRQEEYHREAEEEYARRQAQREDAEENYDHPYSREDEVHGPNTAGRAGARVNNRLLSAASYLGILFVLPYLFAPEDRFARFHAKQGLLLFLFEVVAGIIGSITGIGWLLNLFTLYCVYKGMMAALHGRMEELPVIGKYAGKVK